MLTRRAFLASAVVSGAAPFAPSEAPEIPITGGADANLAPFDKLFTVFLREHQLPGAAVAAPVLKYVQLKPAGATFNADPPTAACTRRPARGKKWPDCDLFEKFLGVK